MQNEYPYRERTVELDKTQELRLGEGKISGYSAVLLGTLSLLAVLAYLYPAYLTTQELRNAYNAAVLQHALKYGMYFSLLFGALTFILNKHKTLGAIGILLTLSAFGLGGYTYPSVRLNRKNYRWASTG